MKITIPGIPKAVQSFRFTKSGRRYQPGQVTEFKNWIKLHALDQRPEGYTMPPDALGVDVLFVFPFPQSVKKSILKSFDAGNTIYKTTKPDLTDNLMKGLIDALTGIIWEGDQQIAEVHSKKIYGQEPRIEINVCELNNN